MTFRTLRRFAGAPGLVVAILLAGCQGAHFVQPTPADAPPDNTASVEAIDGPAGSAGSPVFKVSIVQVWDSKGKKLFDGPNQSYPRVTLQPGAYELQVKCQSDQIHTPPRVGLRLSAQQKYGLHCMKGDGNTVRATAKLLYEGAPAADGAACAALATEVSGEAAATCEPHGPTC